MLHHRWECENETHKQQQTWRHFEGIFHCFCCLLIILKFAGWFVHFVLFWGDWFELKFWWRFFCWICGEDFFIIEFFLFEVFDLVYFLKILIYFKFVDFVCFKIKNLFFLKKFLKIISNFKFIEFLKFLSLFCLPF